MADIDKFSSRLVDLAERFADMTDAAQGRGNRHGTRVRARWLVLPAAGAGIYALGASGSLMRQAKNVVKQAKERATELPEDLMSRVRQASGAGSTASSSTGGTQRSSSPRRRSTGRARTRRRRTAQTSSAR